MDDRIAGHSLRTLLAADIDRYAEQAQAFQERRPGLVRRLGILLNPAVACVAIFRLSHALDRRRWRRAARMVSAINRILHRVEIDPACRIGPGLYIPHPSGVLLRGCAGRNLTLYANVLIGPLAPIPPGARLAGCPVLDDDVTLGAAVLLLGPIRIGRAVRIGPAVTQTEPVPDHMTIARAQRWRITRAHPDI